MGRDSDDFAGRVLESMGSGLVGVDAAGRIVLLNHGARDLLTRYGLGDALADPIARDCREVFRAQPTLASLLLDAVRGGGGLSRAELALDAPDTVPMTLGLTLFPVAGEAGERAGAAMLFRDLTPIERSAEQAALHGRLAALGQMAAGLAHELRNPLASMELIAGLLLRRLPDGEPRELAGDLRGQVRELTQIVKTSLDFVRPTSPQLQVRDPVGLVESALSRVLPRFEPAPEVWREFASDVPCVSVDEETLTIAIGNLIANACQAMVDATERRLTLEVACETPRVESAVRVKESASLSVDKVERELVMAVSDSGPGVPEALREKVFYPFFTTREGGSGIGLATVQKVIAAHGGTLALGRSATGGARFAIHLPLAPESQASP